MSFNSAGVITMTADLTSIAVSSLDLLVTFSDGYNTVGPLPLSLTIVGKTGFKAILLTVDFNQE